MFAENLNTYRRRSDLVAQAQIYRNCAISCDSGAGEDVRVATAQAADELLTIKGVAASFVLFQAGNDVNISARSYGDFNVQLVMEALGGGGHLTMAGALIKECTLEQAKVKLMHVIDTFEQERERSRLAQNNTARSV